MLKCKFYILQLMKDFLLNELLNSFSLLTKISFLTTHAPDIPTWNGGRPVYMCKFVGRFLKWSLRKWQRRQLSSAKYPVSCLPTQARLLRCSSAGNLYIRVHKYNWREFWKDKLAIINVHIVSLQTGTDYSLPLPYRGAISRLVSLSLPFSTHRPTSSLKKG